MKIYNKYNNGIYRIREIFGIKITTKPQSLHDNKLMMDTIINSISHKLDILDLRNKARMQILSLGDEKIIKEKRKERLIVSLTTYPERIYDIDVTLFSLLNQTVKPDKIILWLGKEEFPNLEEDIPRHILNMQKFGIEIKFCKNIKSYKKLIYALQKYPDDVIVTADDDAYYKYDWLEKLYNTYLKEPNYIHCHRAHKILFDKNNNILPYSKWKYSIKSEESEASFLNFFTGVGGVLYKSNLLYKDINKEELFMKLCPSADDIWFWCMAVMNNTKINIVKDNNNIKEIGYEEYNKLSSENCLQNKNDEQIKNIINYYGDKLKNILHNNLPDQTRPDQTRPDQTLVIYTDSIYIHNIIINNKLQPIQYYNAS